MYSLLCLQLWYVMIATRPTSGGLLRQASSCGCPAVAGEEESCD